MALSVLSKSICFQQHLELEQLTKSREAISTAIWREIARVLRDYVHRTDHRRLHLAELKRLDAESAAEITEHQERMRKAEVKILDNFGSDESSIIFRWRSFI